ncbi:transposase [Nocardiopsis dassonvillei]
MVMKVYPPEFKADAVALYRSRPGVTIAHIADELGTNRYNTRRRHSANGQLSPLVYEQRTASLELAA